MKATRNCYSNHSKTVSNKVKGRYLSVKCLQSIPELQKLCNNIGLIFNNSEADVTYEVDMLITDKVAEDGTKYYLVKWLNYSLDQSTWEPLPHLIGCKELIEYYEAIRRSPVEISRKILIFFINEVTTRKPCDILVLTKLCALVAESTETFVRRLKLTPSQLKTKAKEILDMPNSELCPISNSLEQIMLLYECRKVVLVKTAEWETSINSLNPTAFIKVENDVDLEEPPVDFQFIHDYISLNVDIHRQPLAFCCCDNCYENRHSCCPKDSDGHFAYDRYRRLMLLPGYPIYECNKLCKCPPTCVNRVVQHGQKVKVAIFRTSNGCGWGLKSLEMIQKDQFVLEYLGEVITSEDAEARAEMYDHINRTYLFDLDYDNESCTYTVDARHVGNASHFINHSCDPNLHVFAVWINQPDPKLPRLAFFAKRKIQRGEELTFDYKMLKNCDKFEKSDPSSTPLRVLCKCNSKNCKKYLC